MSYDLILEKITKLNNQTEAYTTKIVQLLEGYRKRLNLSTLLGYFTYSISTTNDRTEENIILGDFHIQNLTDATVEELYLCIKINTTEAYKFSGKYFTNTFNMDNKTLSSQWQKFKNPNEENQQEHWFRLVDQKVLLPLETISFRDFQITWKNEGPFSCSIQAFVYTQFEKNGIDSINTINVSTKG